MGTSGSYTQVLHVLAAISDQEQLKCDPSHKAGLWLLQIIEMPMETQQAHREFPCHLQGERWNCSTQGCSFPSPASQNEKGAKRRWEAAGYLPKLWKNNALEEDQEASFGLFSLTDTSLGSLAQLVLKEKWLKKITRPSLTILFIILCAKVRSCRLGSRISTILTLTCIII